MTDTPPAEKPVPPVKWYSDTPSLLAFAAIIIFATVGWSIFHTDIPQANRELAASYLGFLSGSMVGAAFAYYFGSMKGRKEADAANAAVAALTANTLKQLPAPVQTADGPAMPVTDRPTEVASATPPPARDDT